VQPWIHPLPPTTRGSTPPLCAPADGENPDCPRLRALSRRRRPRPYRPSVAIRLSTPTGEMRKRPE
jgi:hypothetical protein